MTLKILDLLSNFPLLPKIYSLIIITILFQVIYQYLKKLKQAKQVELLEESFINVQMPIQEVLHGVLIRDSTIGWE
jgi:hypothetical protein